MSLEEFLKFITKNPLIITLIFAAIPACSFLVSLLHRKGAGKEPPWKYVYTLLVYLTAIPGMFALVITLYSLVFLRTNLLTLDISIHFLPILSMIITLLIIRRAVRFDDIPGFDKIPGLLILIGVSFVIGIVVSRLHIWILFRGSLFSMVIFSAIIFLLFRIGIRLVRGKKQQSGG